MVSTFNNLYSFGCWPYLVSLYNLQNYFTVPLAPQKRHSHPYSFCLLICALHTFFQGLLHNTKGSSLVILSFFFFTFSNGHLSIESLMLPTVFFLYVIPQGKCFPFHGQETLFILLLYSETNEQTKINLKLSKTIF